MDVELFETPGLGDNSYVLVSGKEAAIVDPQRDIWRFADYLDSKELRLRYILETHVHNDYISGALELKDRYRNVDLALPKLGDYEFEHKGMQEGDSLKLGDIELSVMDTPGHTYEHISWIAQQQEDPLAAFTGGSLIVGSAGRTDLLGHDHTPELTKLQFESMQKYRDFDEELKIYPTHGSGSFCTSANPSDTRTSTLKQELETNRALVIRGEEKFMKEMLQGLLEYPDYYSEMAPINRRGPKVYGEPPVPEALDLETFRELMQTIPVVDTREGKDYAKVHIPDSYNYQMASSTFSYIGWTLPFNSPLLIVSGDNYEEDALELTTQLFRIGYEQVKGYLDGGIGTWVDAELPTQSYDAIYADDFDLSTVDTGSLLDVRDPQEISDVPIEGVTQVFIGNIEEVANLNRDKYYVYCVSGQRAATAASFVNRAGKDVTLIHDGGISNLKSNMKN